MTPIMRQPGGDLAAITWQNFNSEGARIGEKLKSLAAETPGVD